MDIGAIRSDSGKVWKIIWDDTNGMVYVEQYGTIFELVLEVGRASSSKQAKAMAETFVNS